MSITWEDEAEIVVVGGGSAGVSCAVSAARLGRSVILVERYGFLGGTATAAMVGPMATFHNMAGEQIVGGIPAEIVGRLTDAGGSPGHVKDTIGVSATYVPFEPEILKLVLLQLAREAGVRILFHGWMAEAVRESGEIKGLKVVTKGGIVSLKGNIFVDASGDGDLAALAGLPFSIGEKDTPPQPMTLIFKVGQVDQKAVVSYILENRREFHHETLFDELQESRFIGVSGFFSQWKEAAGKGEVKIPRDRVLFFSGVREGEMMINTTRITKRDALNPWDLSSAEQEGREQILSLLKFFRKYIPGFQNCYLVQAAAQVGIRETRRIHGEYTLTADDVLQGRSFDDGVAKCSYPIDIHDPEGKGIILRSVGGNGSYDIPYRSLVPENSANLLVAGRCISATHEALGSCRIQATAMAIGQAAGTAAALCVESGKAVSNIPIPKLRRVLTESGAIV